MINNFIQDIYQQEILLVDDDQNNLDLLEATLTGENFTNLQTFIKPTRLIRYLQENTPDLILLDLNMPIIDGLGVLEWMDGYYCTAHQLRPAVIMLTAQASHDYHVKALQKGAQDYVTKPFNIEQLIHRIKIQLEKHALTKELIRHNKNLEQQVQSRTQQLKQAYSELLERLGKAAEYRDNETSNHVNRVSLYAKMLAQKAGLLAKDVDLIYQAAPFHDIGKIGIPDSVLLKPGRLTSEEFDVIKTHVSIGCDILSGGSSEIMQFAYEITQYHHEKYNGTGYPNQLAGEDIPLSGRIVAIADVFDALTSNRPYKDAWPLDKAFDLLQQEKGQHFDPQLVDLFIELRPEIEQIIEQYQDHFPLDESQAE